MKIERMLDGLRRIEAITTRLSLLAAAAMLAALACVCMWQVLARFVLHMPQSWSEVLARTLMIWTTFLALAGAYQRGVMIAVDMVHRMVPTKARRVLEVIVFIANFGVLSALMWNGILMAQRVAGQTLAGINISIAWGYAAIPTGCAIALITVIARFVLRQADPEQAPEIY
jgi:TRAP-type C4-dicarboxylate transport system permease small subunit